MNFHFTKDTFIFNIFPRHFLFFALWILGPAVVSTPTAQVKTQQQVETTIQTPARKGVARGRVIYEDTRRPLRRIQVALFDPAAKSRRLLMAWTNSRGEFQIRDVPFGTYFVSVEAPGIIRADPYRAGDTPREQMTITVDATAPPEAVIRVKRGGAISGKVTYADGDPVINASIRPFLKKDGKWIPVYVGGPSNDRVLTDERGIYRISGLSPGEYVIGAAEQKMGIELTMQDGPGNHLNRSLLPATFYDGVTSLSSATVLEVESGEEETGINITLVERSMHTISGTVTMSTDSLPVARARVSLRRKDEADRASDLEDPVVNTDGYGRFVFDEVYESSYALTVTPPQDYSAFQDDQFASKENAVPVKKFVPKRLDLIVAGSDLPNVNIVVSTGRRVLGVVTVDGGKSLPRNARVALQPADGETSDMPSGLAQEDGSFTLEAVPAGRYYIRTAVPPNNQYYTKSVMHDRLDLTREPLVVQEDEDINNLRILISPDVAGLSGRVLASDGKTPAAGVGIMFVSADSAEQMTMSRRMYGFTNADGSFWVTGAPGDYLAIIMRRGESWLRGDELVSRAAKAQRLTLQAGENKKVDLVLPSDK